MPGRAAPCTLRTHQLRAAATKPPIVTRAFSSSDLLQALCKRMLQDGGEAAVSLEALPPNSAHYILLCLLTKRAEKCIFAPCRRVLQDRGEAAMVRHEAAEALGSIASPVCMALLEDCSTDADPIVAHSCEVALDMLRHEQSGDFQYAAMS